MTSQQNTNGWDTAKLGEVCRIIMGQSPEGSSYNSRGEGMPLLNGPTEFGELHPTAVQWTTQPTKYAEPGDILLCVRGATTGKKNIAKEKFCIGRGLAAIRGTANKTCTDYLWFALDFVTVALLKETAGSTFPNLPGDKLHSIRIPIPSLNAQERIASRLRERLAEVERARAAVEEQLQAAEALPAAFLRSIFSSPAAKQWPRYKLEDVAILQRGRFSPRPRNNPKFYGGSYPFIQTGSAETKDGFIKEWNQTLNEEGLAVSKKFPAGTLVMSIAANIGGLGILTFDSCMPDSLVGINGREGKADNRFLYYVLRLARPALKALAPQMAQANLSLNLLAPFELNIPTLTEQKHLTAKIDAEFSEAQALREQLTERLATIEKLPSAILREAFSGKM